MKKLCSIAEELKSIREKYNIKELDIKTEKWFDDEDLSICIRAEDSRDFYMVSLIFRNEKHEEFYSYEKFIKR